MKSIVVIALIGLCASIVIADDRVKVLNESLSNTPAGLSLYVNVAEGGEISKRRQNHLQDYFQNSQCNIKLIDSGFKSAAESAADIVFMPLKQDMAQPYQQVFGLTVIDDHLLSASILVRSATPISNIAELADVRIAFLSLESITGYSLQKALLNEAGVTLNKGLIRFTNSDLGAMSLLMHQEVYAAAVATPLAKKWAKANDLMIVAQSQPVATGGLWMKNGIALENKARCKDAFKKLFDKDQNSKVKNLAKIFPVWVKGFSPVVD